MAQRPRRPRARKSAITEAEQPAPTRSRDAAMRSASASGGSDSSRQPAFLLRTKLLPPRPAPALLSRPRLTNRLLGNLAHPVTLVTANAGSGKTTLVADFIRSEVRHSVWYQLDDGDSDALVFLNYLARGIQEAIPGFGEVTTSYLRQSSPDLSRRPERAIDVLLNEVLDHAEQQLVVVLDDYHHLAAGSAVHGVVDRLLAYLPDVMHVIIISRDTPPLQLARLRSQASLEVIDRSDLLFTDDETRELFRKVFDLELTPEQLTEYRERTHGWITALQLVRQVAQRQALAADETADLVKVLRQSERDIFSYFAEEVFAEETPDIQRLLLRLSLLDRVSASACAALQADVDCMAALPALVRRNVFITVASDERGEEYRLHPLFRDFLRTRFRAEFGPSGAAAEHRRLVDHFLSRKKWEQAMHHMRAAGDFDAAANLIAERGGEWINSGALASLSSAAAALPLPALEAHPRALAYQAEAMRLRGEYDAAHGVFRRAAILLHDAGDAEGEAEVLHSLATIFRRQDEHDRALEYLDRAEAITAERSRVRIKCGNTRGLCLMEMGNLGGAEREFRAALQLAEEMGDEHYTRVVAHNLGLPAGIRGDFGEALRWSRRILHSGQDGAPVPQEATGHLNVARFHLYRGEFDESLEHVDRALELSQLFNLTALQGEIFETCGSLYRERNDVARAAEYYERARRAYESAGIDLARTELLEEQAELLGRTGDTARARSNLERLVRERAALPDETARHTAALALGRLMFEQGETEAARRELRPALAHFHSRSLFYYEAQTSMALALCAGTAGENKEMAENLRRAVDLAARYDYEYWLKREVKSHAQLLADPEIAELFPPDIRELIPAPTEPPAKKERPAVLAPAAASVTDLTINLLGPVEILRDPERPLAAEAWVTKRARDILCFIASRPHRRASKDTIIDTFWDNADFEVVEKNFHPTISHIRKALNSNQPLKQNFLLYRDGDYLLNPEYSYSIDTEEFDRLLARAEAARKAGDFRVCIAAYEDAIKLYRGDFMQACYDNWAEEPRGVYREQYLRVLEALMRVAEKSQDWTASLNLAQKILRNDPFREDIHGHVMQAHAAMGNRVAVREQYEALRALLRKELGVSPAAETEKLYRSLTG